MTYGKKKFLSFLEGYVVLTAEKDMAGRQTLICNIKSTSNIIILSKLDKGNHFTEWAAICMSRS